jgi:hypothetical protein
LVLITPTELELGKLGAYPIGTTARVLKDLFPTIDKFKLHRKAIIKDLIMAYGKAAITLTEGVFTSFAPYALDYYLQAIYQKDWKDYHT